MIINRTDLVTSAFPPLSNFRSKAEIDWLDISFTIQGVAGIQTVRAQS